MMILRKGKGEDDYEKHVEDANIGCDKCPCCRSEAFSTAVIPIETGLFGLGPELQVTIYECRNADCAARWSSDPYFSDRNDFYRLKGTSKLNKILSKYWSKGR